MHISKWNNDWYFWDNKDSFALVWEVPANARQINLPHDAMLEKDAHADSRNGGNTGFRDGGTYSYAKYIDVSEADKNRTLMLKFEGIYMNAMIYVNGQLAAKNIQGYTDTYVALNDFLHYGARNEIRVQVRNNGMTNSRWYSGTGIYRDVYMLLAGLCYIVPGGLQLHCENADDELASIYIHTELKNRAVIPADAVVQTEISDAEGNIIVSEQTPVTLFAGEQRTFNQRVMIEQPKLWNVDNPYLYTCKTIILVNGEVSDISTESFGIRTMTLDARHGLRINGKSVNLRGACIHHDSGVLGAATYEDAQYRQIQKLKESGFNAVRMSHHPMAPAMLRACDEIGMYVMDESFDMWNRCKSDLDYGMNFSEWWQRDITAMVRKDYNHPSVIMYSIGNEIPEIGSDQGAKIASDICSHIRTIDTTRYTLASINGIFTAGDCVPQLVADICQGTIGDDDLSGNVNNFMALLGQYQDTVVIHPIISKRLEKACAATDIAGYNYMTGRYEPDGKTYPNRVIVGSETYPQALAKNWALVKKLPHLIGDFIWTGWDYIGEAGIGMVGYPGEGGGFAAGFPTQLAYAGDIDITGFRRPTSYYHEIVYGLRKTPFIATQRPDKYGQEAIFTPWTFTDAIETWTWHEYIGKPIVVEIYAPGDEVELLINGKSIGRQPSGEAVGFVARFDTIYEPGEVTAVAYENGQEISRHSLYSAGEAVGIGIEREGYRSDELIYLDVTVIDHDGQVVTDTDMEITARVSGDAVLAGFGSGNPKPLHNYIDSVTDTFHGRALLVLKKTAESGNVNVHIESPILNVEKIYTF